MDTVMDMLKQKLEALAGPTMPEAVETRILRRIRIEAASPAPALGRMILSTAVTTQLIILLALALAMGWVFRSEVAPVLNAAWERAHCWVDSGSKGKDRR